MINLIPNPILKPAEAPEEPCSDPHQMHVPGLPSVSPELDLAGPLDDPTEPNQVMRRWKNLVLGRL